MVTPDISPPPGAEGCKAPADMLAHWQANYVSAAEHEKDEAA